MEGLKKIDELCEPDERYRFYVIQDSATGIQRNLKINDIFDSVKSIELNENAPEDIRSQFNVARNLAIYSWYCYSFHQISEMKAFSTVEMALRAKLGGNTRGLKKLIQEAIKKGLLKDSGFRHIDKPKHPDSIDYCLKLPELMPKLRNTLAHGSTILHPGSVSNLSICADFINQLYPEIK